MDDPFDRDNPPSSPAPWTREDFLSAVGLLGTSDDATDLVSFNMHFDFDEALPSSGDASGNPIKLCHQNDAGSDLFRPDRQAVATLVHEVLVVAPMGLGTEGEFAQVRGLRRPRGSNGHPGRVVKP